MSDENAFSLPNHLITLGNKYFQDFPKNDCISITSKILKEEGHSNSVYDLDDLAWWPTDEDMKKKCPKETQDPAKIAIIKQFLKDFSCNDSAISKDLKEILDNTEFTIAIRPKEQQPTPNGGAVFKKGNDGSKNKAVLMVSEVLFEDENRGILPGLLAHEMGHFIDFYNRPQNDAIKLKYMDGAETFADTIGVMIAKNAGHNCDGWAKFLQTASEKGLNPPYTHSGIHRAKTIYECSNAYDNANKKYQEKATSKNTSEDKPDLVLDNGLRIFYEEDSEKSSLSFNMTTKINSNNENKEINFAMNHLIEHCIRVADPIKAQQFEEDNLRPKDCQTFYDRIEYRKQGNSENTAKILDCYGELFSNWHMPHIDAEREVIFEEWCNVYNQKDKWAFLTDYFQNENNTYIHPQFGAKLLTPEYVEKNREKIHKWFNNQINYTKDFSKEDIIACARHTYSASNMTMRCRGNMPKEEFLKLVKESSLSKIPHINENNPLAYTTDQSASQNLVSKLDMEDFKISSVSMSYNLENPEHAKIMKEFLKSRMRHKLQKEQPNAYIVDFNSHGIESKISTPKSQQTQDKMAQLLQQIHDSPINAKEIIQLQKKFHNPSISPQLLKSLIAQVYETAQINVNGENKGLVKEYNQSSKDIRGLSLNSHMLNLRNGHNLKTETPRDKSPYKPARVSQMTLSRLKELKNLSK